MNDMPFSHSDSPHMDVRPQSSQESDFYQALHELRVMLLYALAEGLDLDEKTREVAAVADYPKPDFYQVMAAHVALAKLVAPATPRTLEATEPVPGWLGSLRRPPLILAMIVVAIVSAIGFIVTGLIASPSNKGSTNQMKAVMMASYPNDSGARFRLATLAPASDSDKPPVGVPPEAPSWQKELNWCFAAALGAVFYVLFTAHEYVKKRTFDPRYNSMYLIRFVLGVLAGLILASILSAPRFVQNETLRSLGPAIAALLGGFSADAVYQILQRLVDVMLAAIRGDNSDTAKAKASETARKELLSLAADPGVSPPLLSKIHAAVQKIG